MSKSIFSSANIIIKTPFANNIINDPLVILSDELKYIQILITSPAVIYLKNVLHEYYLGNFQEVLILLQPSKLTYLTNLIWSYRKSPVIYPNYEKIRAILELYLKGLTQQNVTYLQLLNTETKLEKCKERSSILDNMNKLREYIENLSKTMNLFNPEPQTIVAAKVLQEHAIYLRTYGYPLGGIFDPELLQEIVNNMSQVTTPQLTPLTSPSITPSITPLTSPLITPLTSPQITPLTSPQITPSTTPSTTPPTTPSTTPPTTPR